MRYNAVLLSIQPRWCELIASGKKTIEIRKTRPKLGEPFKCYIYCTQGKKQDDILTFAEYENGEYMGDYYANGKVIGEFICDSIYEFEAEISKRANAYESITLRKQSEDYDEYGDYRYSLVAENGDNANWFMHQSCLYWDDLKKYLGNKSRDFYGWHISDLVIYDKPKELGEFGLRHAPQSWCYIKENGNGKEF